MIKTLSDFESLFDELKISRIFKCWNHINNAFGIKWIIGGHYEDHASRQPECKPEFEELYTILNVIRPNITFLEYKKLYKNCVIKDNYDADYIPHYVSSSSEYYGVNYIEIETLFNFLKKQEWL